MQAVVSKVGLKLTIANINLRADIIFIVLCAEKGKEGHPVHGRLS